MALLPVEDALNQMLARVKPATTKMVPLPEALHQTTTQDINATLTQPPFDSSAMDGFAVIASDTDQATNTALKIITTIPAGTTYQGTLQPGQTARIFTGAPMPAGANAVLMQEDATYDAETMTPNAEIASGRHVRPMGNDFTKGQTLTPKGTKLTPHDIALLAAANCATIPVAKAPTITLASTGDELVTLGTEPGIGQIISSNPIGLKALLNHHGATCTDHGTIADSLETTTKAFRTILTSETPPDILVTIGGASVGDHDYVQDALIAAGAKIAFWKIALRPGKPLMFGTFGDTLILGLPGNPVSALTCAHIFLLPIIRKALGQSAQTPTIAAKITADLPANGPRQFYLRASFARTPDGTLTATPVNTQDSGHLRSLADADGFVIIAPDAPALKTGDPVTAMLFD